MSGCIWIPGFPLDRVPLVVDPIPDTRPLSHCSPRHSAAHPVLLGVQTGERQFGCRARSAASIVWSIEFIGPALEGYVLGAGVPSIRLSRADLPYYPVPYEAILRIEDQGEGESTTRDWTLVVLPDPDALRLSEDGQ